MRFRNGVTCLLACTALVTGCGGDSNGGAEGGFEGDVTFEDSFDEDSDWAETTNEFVTYGISEGEYLMDFKQRRSVSVAPIEVASKGVDVADSVQTVDVRSETPESPVVGLLCRWDNETTAADLTGYAFVVSSRADEGARWQLRRGIFGDVETLANGTLDLDLSKETAALEASCVGETLTFTINGEEVASVTDGNLSTGFNGLAGLGLEGRPFPLTATFDNYVLEYDEP